MRSAAVKEQSNPVLYAGGVTAERPALSLVFPIYNEEVVLPTLFARLD